MSMTKPMNKCDGTRLKDYVRNLKIYNYANVY